MSTTYVSYWEKLKDPRWQRRRLEIMQRDDFACTACGDKGATLNVHHGYYEKGLNPWDYKDETLFTLCESCHEEAHGFMTAFLRTLGTLPPSLYSDVLYDLHLIAQKHAADGHELKSILPPGSPIYWKDVRSFVADREERAREARAR